MGLGEWWNGSYKLMPGVQDDINRYGDIGKRARAYGEQANLGVAGRSAKDIIKAMRMGDFDSNPVISSYFAPLRNQIETGKRDLVRRATMGVNRIAPGQQAGLLNAQTNLAMNRADESGAMAMQEMIPQLYGQASGTFQNALQGKRGQEEFGFGGEMASADAINRARATGTFKTGGFKSVLNDIGSIAGSIGGAIAGMPGIGAAGGFGQIAQNAPKYARARYVPQT